MPALVSALHGCTSRIMPLRHQVRNFLGLQLPTVGALVGEGRAAPSAGDLQGTLGMSTTPHTHGCTRANRAPLNALDGHGEWHHRSLCQRLARHQRHARRGAHERLRGGRAMAAVVRGHAVVVAGDEVRAKVVVHNPCIAGVRAMVRCVHDKRTATLSHSRG